MLALERRQQLAQGWLVSSTTLGEVKASLLRVLVGFRTLTGLDSAQNLYSFSLALTDPQCCLSQSLLPWDTSLRRNSRTWDTRYLAAHWRARGGRRIRLASLETSGLPPNGYGNKRGKGERGSGTESPFL